VPIDALSVLCAQLTRDLLAIAKFLLHIDTYIMCDKFRENQTKTVGGAVI